MSLNMREKWTVSEKKKLTRLLSIYPIDAYENIAANFPKRSTNEVRDYIKKMIYSTKMHLSLNKEKNVDMTKAPLEIWLEVVKGLVDMEQFDYSTCLSKVMEFISNFEDFPEGNIEGHPQPDYRMIYKYISQILEGNRREDIDELGPLESAVVVDLIHSLMEVLSDADLTVQYNVMRWKYLLLKERDHLGHPIPELLRQAAENDFREFLKSSEGDDVTEETEKKDDSTSSSVEATPTQAGTSQTKSGEADKSETQTQNIVARYTYEANYSADQARKKSDPHKYLNNSVYHNKPGRKHQKQTNPTINVTEIVRVVPPKNAVIVNKAPRAKQPPKSRTDGKYFGLNVDDSKVKNEEDNKKDSNPDCDILYNKKADSVEAWESRKRKYESLSKKKDGKKEVKKDKWYSLNPFCVPISLLDLDS